MKKSTYKMIEKAREEGYRKGWEDAMKDFSLSQQRNDLFERMRETNDLLEQVKGIAQENDYSVGRLKEAIEHLNEVVAMQGRDINTLKG